MWSGFTVLKIFCVLEGSSSNSVDDPSAADENTLLLSFPGKKDLKSVLTVP